MRIWLAAAVFAFWLLSGAADGGLPDEARTHASH
jgi:hypothetical protein